MPRRGNSGEKGGEIHTRKLWIREGECVDYIREATSFPGIELILRVDSGGEDYADRKAVTEALIPIVNAELKALAAAGVDFLQLDEPSFACHPDAPDQFLDLIARTVHGVSAYISMHMCFGNYRARAVGHRSYRPLFPHIGRAWVNQLALEFASREMAEIELLAELPETMDVAVGLVDVKNTWVEPPDLVASRIRTVLKHVPPERISITPDCGFSQTARHIAVAKAKSLAEGAKIIRQSSRHDPAMPDPESTHQRPSGAETMIEPSRQGPELIEEILETHLFYGLMAIWWLGQSGFLIKTDGAFWGSIPTSPSTSRGSTRAPLTPKSA